MTTGIAFIAVYVKLRCIVLLLDAFIPPLLRVEKEKSWRYPEGATIYSSYFENDTLITLYVINIIFCFFLLCYGIATYYSWSLSQSDLFPDKMDKLIYQKMPQVHQIYVIYVLIQISILIGIDQLDLPPTILIFKPDYYSLSASLILELFILHYVTAYVSETMEIINGIRAQQKREAE